MDRAGEFRRSGVSRTRVAADRRSATALLIEQICQGATSYKEIKERPVWPVVKSWLNAAQQSALDDLAPERIKLPNGRTAKIIYAPGADHRGAHPGSLWRYPGPNDRPGSRAVADPGPGPESSPDSDHQRPDNVLAGELSENQEGTAAEVSEAPVALRQRAIRFLRASRGMDLAGRSIR